MDRWEALFAFWNSFGVKAYEENSVPSDPANRPDFPYITYEAMVSPWNADVLMSASIWTRSTSWEQADGLSDEVENRIKDGYTIPYDGGIIVIYPNDPFAKHMGEPDDDLVKRVLLGPRYHFH